MSKNVLASDAEVTKFGDVLPPLDVEAQRNRKLFDPGGKRDRARQEGYEDGFKVGSADGYIAGLAEARDEYGKRAREACEQFTEALQRIDVELTQGLTEWTAGLEVSLERLAVALTGRLLHAELAANPEAVTGIVRAALGEVMHGVEVRVLVNPFDADVVRKHKASILNAAAGLKGISVVEDPSMAGGCIVETEGAIIDARIESMLANLLEEVRR